LRGRSLAAEELKLALTLEHCFRDSSWGLANETTKDTEDDEGKAQGGNNENGDIAPQSRGLRQGGTFERIIRLPVPLLDPKIFLKLLQLDLNANPPGAPITKVYLRMEPAKPRPAQNGFFIPSSPEPEKLELTLARINGIVGDGRAGSPVLLDSYRGDAFEMRRFSPTESASWSEARVGGNNGNGHKALARLAVREHSTLDHVTDALVTALRIFRPAIDVRINYSKGHLSHIRSLKGRQICGEIVWSAGPWRSSGDWWEQDAWMRDEWDIAVEEKAGIVLYRLVHDLISGRWMLEGSYD
jgi:protein ImuB